MSISHHLSPQNHVSCLLAPCHNFPPMIHQWCSHRSHSHCSSLKSRTVNLYSITENLMLKDCSAHMTDTPRCSKVLWKIPKCGYTITTLHLVGYRLIWWMCQQSRALPIQCMRWWSKTYWYIFYILAFFQRISLSLSLISQTCAIEIGVKID